MFNNVLNKISSVLGFGDTRWNADSSTRRQHPRHTGLKAEVVVGGRAYSLHDWSIGGLSFEAAPDARLTAGDKIQVSLKFSFPHETITIQQQAHVVRAVKRGIAAKFAPLPAESRLQFERVLDSLYSQGFLESQVA